MDTFTFDATGELDGTRLSGVVHVFGTRTVRAGVTHEFDPGAFDKSLADSDVFAFYSHDTSKPLASRLAGSLELEVRDGKLHYQFDTGAQSYAQDLRVNVAAGLMRSMSFGVLPRKWEMRAGVKVHTEASLFDVSPVTIPAFGETSAQLHSSPVEWSRSQAVRARARVQESRR